MAADLRVVKATAMIVAIQAARDVLYVIDVIGTKADHKRSQKIRAILDDFILDLNARKTRIESRVTDPGY